MKIRLAAVVAALFYAALGVPAPALAAPGEPVVLILGVAVGAASIVAQRRRPVTRAPHAAARRTGATL